MLFNIPLMFVVLFCTSMLIFYDVYSVILYCFVYYFFFVYSCLFPIFVQVCRLLPLGGKLFVVNIISYHIISYHIISYHIISYIISYHIISYHIISYHIISYHVSHHIISYIIYHISYHIIHNVIYYIIIYHIYHIISHIISSYLINLTTLLLYDDLLRAWQCKLSVLWYLFPVFLFLISAPLQNAQKVWNLLRRFVAVYSGNSC